MHDVAMCEVWLISGKVHRLRNPFECIFAAAPFDEHMTENRHMNLELQFYSNRGEPFRTALPEAEERGGSEGGTKIFLSPLLASWRSREFKLSAVVYFR